MEWVPTLFEGAEGEPIHTLENRNLRDAMRIAAESLITEAMVHSGDRHEYLVPVPNHIKGVQMYDVARLRYRAHTRATSAWWARERQAEQDYIGLYRKIAGHEGAEAVA